jgi:hypothetical protein
MSFGAGAGQARPFGGRLAFEFAKNSAAKDEKLDDLTTQS